MSEPQAIPAQVPTPGFRMIRTLGAIAMLSGLLVVLVYQYTKPIIAENQRIAIEKAIFQVVPGAVSRKDFIAVGDRLLPADSEGAQGERIYAAYAADGRLRGVALQAAAQGYQDVIKVLYGYGPECQCIIGMKVLKMAETPGLGDKIASDPGFLRNFEALDAQVDAGGAGLAHPIVTVKHGAKTEPWQIDAISGATVSSKAIGRMLNASAQHLIPLIQRDLALLQHSN